jgi:DNA-binding cell septation regulator SpoVG
MTRPQISVVRIRPVAGHGNLRAFADVRIGALTFYSLRVIQQPAQRAWVSLPQVLDAEGRYRPVITCDDEALKMRIRDAVLRAWSGQLAPDKYPPALPEAPEGGHMSLTALSIRLDRIDESLLFQDKHGRWWLNCICICTFEEDQKGRLTVAQSVPRERYAAGEKGPSLGTWREIGSATKAPDQQAKRFDLSRYKNAAQSDPQAPNQYPLGREEFAPPSQSSAQGAGNHE